MVKAIELKALRKKGVRICDIFLFVAMEFSLPITIEFGLTLRNVKYIIEFKKFMYYIIKYIILYSKI